MVFCWNIWVTSFSTANFLQPFNWSKMDYWNSTASIHSSSYHSYLWQDTNNPDQGVSKFEESTFNLTTPASFDTLFYSLLQNHSLLYTLRYWQPVLVWHIFRPNATIILEAAPTHSSEMTMQTQQCQNLLYNQFSKAPNGRLHAVA